MKLVLAALCLLASIAAPAEVYRCTARGGAITYQEIPCPSSSEAVTMDIPSAFPEVNRLERDRLLAREAALEARMLERAKIDAAERMARDDRLARERELQELREALARREAEQAVPGFLVVRPFAPPRIHSRFDRRIPPQRL